jgi:toxin ParE1/3/4
VKARYTTRAVSDLNDIADYILAHSPLGAAKVRAEIQRTVALIERFPFAGSRTTVEPVRRIGVRKYPYLVYYVVDRERRDLIIVTIQHGARLQPFETS